MPHAPERPEMRKNALILQNPWYIVRRLSDGTIEVWGGPFNSKKKIYRTLPNYPLGVSVERGRDLDKPLVDKRG